MKVYLGAGRDRKEGYKHLDIYPFEGIDIVADVTKGLPFEDSSVDEIFTQDLLEHLPTEAKIPLMNEIWRVLKPDGIMEHWVPLAGTRNDYGSPTHLSHWHPQQFEHFDVDSYRYTADHEYEGFKGGFRTVSVDCTTGSTGETPQSFRIVMKAVK